MAEVLNADLIISFLMITVKTLKKELISSSRYSHIKVEIKQETCNHLRMKIPHLELPYLERREQPTTALIIKSGLLLETFLAQTLITLDNQTSITFRMILMWLE